MRVLIISHGFPPSARGGAELYAQMHAGALAEAGDAVLVLTREADPGRSEFAVRREQRNNIEIVWINNTFSSVRQFADTYTDDRIDAIAARVSDDFKPDVAHVHHLTCLSTTIVQQLAARSVPVFCTLHDYWLLCHRGQLLDRDLHPCRDPRSCTNCLGPEASAPALAFAGRAAIMPAARYIPDRVKAPMRAAAVGLMGLASPADRSHDAALVRRDHMREVMARISHFFAPSKHLRDRFVAAGLDPARISVSEYGWALPHPVDADAVPAGAARQRVPLNVGFLGSLMVSKAPHLLMEACAGLAPGACIVHVFGDHADYHGDRTYRDVLAPLLARADVRFHGSIQRDELSSAFGQIDVLAVPSIWPENSPLVIREAFLAGVPVIASRIGGIPETVSDEVSGLLFEPGDAADLRRVVRRLIDEPELLSRLRAGIPAVRTVDDDVASMRAKYRATLTEEAPKRRRLAAIVLNYGTPDDTFLATRSLLQSRRAIDHVIVVDNDEDTDSSSRRASPLNGSRRDAAFSSSRRASARRPCLNVLAPLLDRISYLPTGRNLGFAGGMNAGIQHALEAGADAVLLVNSDMVVPVDCVTALERALYATPGAGIAGPVIVGRSGPDRIASLGISYNELTGRMRHRGVGAPLTTVPASAAAPVEAVSGCMMLVKRDVFDRTGTFASDAFFSFEDLDFCLRARDAGFSSIVVPGATALHEGGRSMGANALRFYFGARNHLWLARRRGGPGGWPGALARSTFIVALNVAHAIRVRGGSLPGRLSAVARGTQDYFRGNLGGGNGQA